MGPRPPERITPEWLTHALRSRGVIADERVSSVAAELIGDFSNRLWRLRLAYAEEPRSVRAPRSLVLKHPREDREDPASDGAHRQTFVDEIRFYQELAPQVPVETPVLYFADVEGLMLGLEDVTGLEPVDFVRGATDQHLRLAIDDLARLHAAFHERVADIDWIPSLADQRHRQALGMEFDRSWPERRAGISEIVADFVPVGDALQGRVPNALAPLGADETLLHGDAHFENLALFRRADDEVSVLFHDWAAIRRGSPSFDVAVFVIMSLPTNKRRTLERDLVSRHDQALRSAGVERGDPWQAYRRGVLAWAVRMVQFSKHASDSPGLRLVTHRTALAALDHRVDELLRDSRP